MIKTTERMTYSDVNKILIEKDEELLERYEALVPMLELMEELAQLLREKRMNRGAIDFDFKESKVLWMKMESRLMSCFANVLLLKN